MIAFADAGSNRGVQRDVECQSSAGQLTVSGFGNELLASVGGTPESGKIPDIFYSLPQQQRKMLFGQVEGINDRTIYSAAIAAGHISAGSPAGTLQP